MLRLTPCSSIKRFPSLGIVKALYRFVQHLPGILILSKISLHPPMELSVLSRLPKKVEIDRELRAAGASILLWHCCPIVAMKTAQRLRVGHRHNDKTRSIRLMADSNNNICNERAFFRIEDRFAMAQVLRRIAETKVFRVGMPAPGVGCFYLNCDTALAVNCKLIGIRRHLSGVETNRSPCWTSFIQESLSAESALDGEYGRVTATVTGSRCNWGIPHWAVYS